MNKEQKKTRGRPRTTDVLPLPRNALRQMKLISSEAKIPIEQVYEDVVENGLMTVREMYDSLIKYRQTRTKLYESQFDDGVAEESDPGGSERLPIGEENGSIDPEFGVITTGEDPDETGSSDDDDGFPAENGEVVEVSGPR